MARRFGLRLKSIFFIIALLVVLFGSIMAVAVARAAVTERQNLNEQTKSFATLATKPIGDAFLLYKDSGQIRIKQQTDKFTDLNPDVTGVSIVNTKGEVIFQTGDAPQVNANQASTFEPIYIKQNKVITKVISPVVEDFGVHRYAIVYGISDARLQSNIQRTVGIILLLSVVAFAAAMVVTYWGVNVFFLSPVRRISGKALDISNGHFDEHIDLKRNDEIGDLATAVNTMAKSLEADIIKLQEADKLKSEFITISSHNLRTPLTVIKGDLEIMRDMGVPEKLESMISDVSASTVHLNNFIEDLLAISSMESGRLAASEMKPAPIKGLLEAISTDYTQVARTKNLEFKLDFQVQDEQVVMSQHLLRMAFVNLLENAFKFTKEGSVSLEAAVKDGQAEVKVSDTGIGIEQAELPKLFTKFHRGTSVMRYDYEGTGIGLYLTKLIITDHNGQIVVDSTEGKGTVFTVTLPLASNLVQY
jgi:signal transduction histidine kinase